MPALSRVHLIKITKGLERVWLQALLVIIPLKEQHRKQLILRRFVVVFSLRKYNSRKTTQNQVFPLFLKKFI